MSENRIRLEGLEELRRALRQLPEELTNEAAVIVEAHADSAARDVVNGYPQGPTGNLRRLVVSQRNKSRLATQVIVRSRAPHAWLFENGSQTRKNSKGANRGQMPQAEEARRMIPKIIRARRKMTEALIGLVENAGFKVDA